VAESASRESSNRMALTLRIRHPSIDPQEITDSLGMLPLAFWKAGDPRRDGRGQRLQSRYRESYWTGAFTSAGRLPSAVSTAEASLMLALVSLRRSQPFLNRLQEEGGSVELLLHVVGDEEFKLQLAPLTGATLAKAGITLILEMRPEGEAEARRLAG